MGGKVKTIFGFVKKKTLSISEFWALSDSLIKKLKKKYYL